MDQKRTNTIFYFFAFTSLGLITGILGPSLPTFAFNTQSSLKQLSTLFIFSSIGFMGGAWLAGQLLTRVKGNRMIAVVLLVISAGLIALPLVRQLWLLVAILFLVGIAQGHLDVGENSLLIWLHGEKVAPYMNALHFFFGVGSFCAPLFIGLSLQFFEQINWAYWLMAIIILIPAYFLSKIPSPDLSETSHNANNQQRSQSNWPIILLVLFFFAYAGSEVTFSNWLYTYSLVKGFTNAQTAAFLTSAFWGAFTISRLLGVFLSRKLTVKAMLLTDIFGSLLSMLLILVGSKSYNVLWIGTIGFGLFMASAFPTGMNLAERIGAVSSRVTSFFFIAASTGAMVSPWLTGQWFESFSPKIMVWMVLANLFLALLLCFPLLFIKKKSA